MGAVCAPVTVATVLTEAGRPHGTTVSSLASLSLDPPLVSIALDHGSALLGHLHAGAVLGVNVLADGQEGLALHFARRGADKFAGIDWSADDGAPRLPGTTAWLAGTVRQRVPAGDHDLLVVTVHTAATAEAAPLVHARRTFGTHSAFAP
ncbi:flavin reductase (plasmid) [Pseudonocardia sp. EC080610-09]|nr:flavin reductase [Pseudonocardia sp. EC080610-09]ALL85762.1 flavin reductase [Pseudonocardia sp. EC080619-01]